MLQVILQSYLSNKANIIGNLLNSKVQTSKTTSIITSKPMKRDDLKKSEELQGESRTYLQGEWRWRAVVESKVFYITLGKREKNGITRRRMASEPAIT